MLLLGVDNTDVVQKDHTHVPSSSLKFSEGCLCAFPEKLMHCQPDWLLRQD